MSPIIYATALGWYFLGNNPSIPVPLNSARSTIFTAPPQLYEADVYDMISGQILIYDGANSTRLRIVIEGYHVSFVERVESWCKCSFKIDYF